MQPEVRVSKNEQGEYMTLKEPGRFGISFILTLEEAENLAKKIEHILYELQKAGNLLTRY